MPLNIGKAVSSKDTELINDSMLPEFPQEDSKRDISQVGNALWSYKFEHKINGIAVDATDLDLPIDRDDLLFAAFQLNSRPRSAIFWLSPDDKEAIEKYDELLQQVYDGKILIQEELKQYDSCKSKFMVWIRYIEVSYSLHPRFNYIREELAK